MRHALLAALLALAVRPASAFEDSDWSVAAYGDIMTVGNSGKHLSRMASGACPGCPVTNNTSPAYGGRLGVFHVEDQTRLGVSVGGLAGGPLRGSASGSLPTGSVTGTASASTARLLAEAGRLFRFNDSFAGALGVGFGAAAVNETLDWTCTGAFAPACGQLPSGTSDTGWVAWELNASLIFEGLEAGLRVGGFGRGHNLPWTALGYFAGYRF